VSARRASAKGTAQTDLFASREPLPEPSPVCELAWIEVGARDVPVSLRCQGVEGAGEGDGLGAEGAAELD